MSIISSNSSLSCDETHSLSHLFLSNQITFVKNLIEIWQVCEWSFGSGAFPEKVLEALFELDQAVELLMIGARACLNVELIEQRGRRQDQINIRIEPSRLNREKMFRISRQKLTTWPGSTADPLPYGYLESSTLVTFWQDDEALPRSNNVALDRPPI